MLEYQKYLYKIQISNYLILKGVVVAIDHASSFGSVGKPTHDVSLYRK